MKIENLRPLPTDGSSRTASRGTEATVFLNATNNGLTTGSFQAIILPSGVECKAVMIQVHNGVVDDFTSYGANPIGFHFSSTGSNVNKDFTNHIGSHVIDIGRISGETIGFVRADANQYVVVEVIE